MKKKFISFVAALVMVMMAVIPAQAAKQPVNAAIKSPVRGIINPDPNVMGLIVFLDPETDEVIVYFDVRNGNRVVIEYDEIELEEAEDDFGHKYFKAKDGNWVRREFTSSPATFKLPKNKLFKFRAAGINASGRQGNYTYAQPRITSTLKPEIKATSDGFNIKADKVDNATGYQISYDAQVKTVKSNKGLDKTIKGLKKGSYNVKARPLTTVVVKENRVEGEKYDVTKDKDKITETYYGIYSEKEKIEVK